MLKIGTLVKHKLTNTIGYIIEVNSETYLKHKEYTVRKLNGDITHFHQIYTIPLGKLGLLLYE